MLEIIYELDVCEYCAVLHSTGDGSADEEDAARRYDAWLGRWGDLMAQMSDATPEGAEGTDMFRCDLCGDDVMCTKYQFVVLG